MKAGLAFIIFWILASGLCDTISQLLLKSCINTLDIQVNGIKKALQLALSVGKIPRAWVGLLFSILSLFIWLFVLTNSDLNFAFSLDSMRYVLIALASTVVLKERISSIRWLGILAVVIGITLVTLG